MKIWQRLARIMLTAVGAIVLAGMLAFVALCVAVDRYGSQERAQPADAVVILGARVLPTGELGPDLAPRVEKAVQVYRQGLAGMVVCTGGAGGDPMSAAAIARRAAIQRGVPPAAILVADGTSNTRQDALRVAELMRARRWSKVIIVSHPLHVLRATMLFRQAGLTVYASPTTTELSRIPAHWRLFYGIREAALIVHDWLAPQRSLPDWMANLRQLLLEAGLDDLG